MRPACPLRLHKGKETAIRKGFPWAYAGDFIESSELLHLPPGSLVSIETARGEWVATGYYNARSRIACRVLTRTCEAIDANFFERLLQRAIQKRAMIGVPYYRLAHSEADGLPGLTIDRFGDALVVQCATAGMEALQPFWLAALEQVLSPQAVVLRNDIPSRRLEGLAQEVRVIKEEAGGFTEVQENGCIYFADLLHGQKTGWFYDQRANRSMIAQLAGGKTLLDVYSHSGGFGVLAAKAGARVTLVDSSALALELAQKAALRGGVRCDSLQGDALAVMGALAQETARFDIVLADPPAFVKAKKDIAAGMKGYAKVARHAAALVAEGGLLFMASCSHHASRGAFNRAVMEGVEKAGRKAVIQKQTGADSDHPHHPLLAQSEYLKGLLLKLA